MRRDIIKTIAEPTRRAIIALLALQVMTSNSITEHFDSIRQAISKHIKILTECEVARQQQTGREIYYHFNPNKMKEVDKWLDHFRKLWGDRYYQLDHVLKNL